MLNSEMEREEKEFQEKLKREQEAKKKERKYFKVKLICGAAILGVMGIGMFLNETGMGEQFKYEVWPKINVIGKIRYDMKTDYDSRKVYDTVYFGSYEQDGDEKNGKEPIEWIVLEKTGHEMVLMSKYALFAGEYVSKGDNGKQTVYTWENSNARKMLNSEFYNEAFSDSEKEKILEHFTPALEVFEEDYRYSVDQGNNVNDYVYLLSEPELRAYYEDNRKVHLCKCTEAARQWNDDTYVDYWLRSRGNTRVYYKGNDCDYLYSKIDEIPTDKDCCLGNTAYIACAEETSEYHYNVGDKSIYKNVERIEMEMASETNYFRPVINVWLGE